MSNAVMADQEINGCKNIVLDKDYDRLLTIRQFCALFPWPSESAMRAYVYRADELGISDAFVRVNRRVLVDPSKFFVLIKQLESRSTKGGIYETTLPKKGTTNERAF